MVYCDIPIFKIYADSPTAGTKNQTAVNVLWFCHRIMPPASVANDTVGLSPINPHQFTECWHHSTITVLLSCFYTLPTLPAHLTEFSVSIVAGLH